jgi:hypothetical protein
MTLYGHTDVFGSGAVPPIVLPLAWMAKLFAKHADLGGLRLETKCIKGEWEWWVVKRKDRTEVGRGKSTSLGDAMLAAEKLAGGEPAWHNFGPEVTDERKKVVTPRRAERR